jgi:hypothetical protein
MPLTIPAIDARSYQDLRDEGLARIPVHNPEWTNFNRSDPGVTLIEVFAFLTENLLYRANQIPERSRRKFLTLLGRQLRPASAAQGLVAFANERGPLEVTTLTRGFEVQGGRLTFRIDQGLDVLPVEARIFYKREVDASDEIRKYYDQLYASFLLPPLPQKAKLYQTVPLDGTDGVDMTSDTVDRALWIALIARKSDTAGPAGKDLAALTKRLRELIGGKTLTLGAVPALTDAIVALKPGGTADPERTPPLVCQVPADTTAARPTPPATRVPKYKRIAVVGDNVLLRPGTVQITLPRPDELQIWKDLDPLEAGVGDFPPAIEDTDLENRVVTWLRLSVPPQAQARLRWVGINAARVSQRTRVTGERLPEGTGAPDQVARLALRPVLADSIRLFVTRPEGTRPEEWYRIDDLGNAASEVPAADARARPRAREPEKPPAADESPASPQTGSAAPTDPRIHVFMLDAEAGELRFGDGLRGARPPLGATLVADYEYSEGREGNVNEGAIKTGAALPPGFSVDNPVATWGGADAETVAEGEKQVQRWLQHRDRLVSAEDFVTIAWRTPGVEIGRIDVIPASSPELGTNEPGDAPGAVTLMIVPRHHPARPDAPEPDRLFLDTICSWLDPRRLVTTEVFLRGPVYKDIWLSVGIDVATERSIAEVRQAVDRALRAALAPLPPADAERGPAPLLPVFTPASPDEPRGWPLRKAVVALELVAVVARVPGVTGVRDVLLIGANDTTSQSSIGMRGLELPRIAGIIVTVGAAIPVTELRGTPALGPPTADGGFVPVPFIPEEC